MLSCGASPRSHNVNHRPASCLTSAAPDPRAVVPFSRFISLGIRVLIHVLLQACLVRSCLVDSAISGLVVPRVIAWLIPWLKCLALGIRPSPPSSPAAATTSGVMRFHGIADRGYEDIFRIPEEVISHHICCFSSLLWIPVFILRQRWASLSPSSSCVFRGFDTAFSFGANPKQLRVFTHFAAFSPGAFHK